MDIRECMTVILENGKTKDASSKIIPSLLLGITLSNVKRKKKNSGERKIIPHKNLNADHRRPPEMVVAWVIMKDFSYFS